MTRKRRGTEISHGETERIYIYIYIRAPSGTLRLQEAEIKKAEDFKYLESTGQSNVEWGKKSEKGAWSWRE